MNRVKKTKIAEAFERKNLVPLSIPYLHDLFRVDPNCEQDRPRVWSIGQGVAELLRDGVLVPITGRGFHPRTYRLKELV
jgi:hypothetical protein